MPYLIQHAAGVSVMNLSLDADIKEEIPKWSAANPDLVVSAVTEIDQSAIPADRTFRGAWRHCEQNGIRHCMDTARNIHRDRMREKRKLLFSEVDAAFMRAQMQGLSTAEVAAKAQQLRNVTAAPEIDQVQTIEELKELWPTETLGETLYVAPPPVPEPQPEPEPYGWAGDVPLWTKEEYDAYAAEFAAAVGKDMPDELAEEPPPASDEEQTDLKDFLAAPPPIEEPLDLPRMFARDVQPEAPANAFKEAMRRVDQLEANDAPIPDYTPPPEPAREVFADMRPIDHEQRLQNAVDDAYVKLQKMKWRFDIAAMAMNGNGPAELKLQPEADRRGCTTAEVADRIVADWRRRETALAEITELQNLALGDIAAASPSDVEFIVDEAIERIEKGVSDATANRA